MVRTVFIRTFCTLFIAFGLVGQSQASSDVRLVIDVSGSMKQNDPQNLRKPAIDLLVQLMPQNGQAGVWTFGQYVNMLVPLGITDPAWVSNAQQQSEKIVSTGLFTNIGEALEKASYITSTNQYENRDIILLTDGMVDISNQDADNDKEWRRIVDQVIPQLQLKGFNVHTIALSSNADKELLDRISIETEGSAAVVTSAQGLMDAFLNAFDAAVPKESVPLTDNKFLIDESVQEFTALLFRQGQSDDIALLGPEGVVHRYGDDSSLVNWYRTDKYDLITVKKPFAGEWQIDGKLKGNSRVTVVSNLRLGVEPLPLNAQVGEQFLLEYGLFEDGNVVTRPEFLSLMDVEAELIGGKDEFDFVQVWSENPNMAQAPASGSVVHKLPEFDRSGIYQINVVVDGKSFIREFNHQINVRAPFDARLDVSKEHDGKRYKITVNAYAKGLDYTATRIAGTLVKPNGRKKIVPLKDSGQDAWEEFVIPDEQGKYTFIVKAKGQFKNGQAFDITLPELSFNYVPGEGFVKEEETFTQAKENAEVDNAGETASDEASTDTGPAEGDAKEEKEAEEVIEPTDDGDVQSEEPASLKWLIYGLLGVGNLVILGLAYLAYKKLLGKKEDELPLDGKKREEPETGALDESSLSASDLAMNEMSFSPDDEPEEEPPMEDLDVGFDEELENEVDDSSEPLAESLDDLLAEDEPADSVDALDGNTEENVSSVNDELDDLDAMSESIQSEDVELDSPLNDDELVDELLKEQGLDVAEDQLDDAISSLIDDLDEGGDQNNDENPEPDK